MGQQQLLLIVLGVIIVGIAVVVGINLFNANAEESTKDTIVSEGTNLGALAQQFAKKPKALGGGGNRFDKGGAGDAGFTIPTQLLNTTSAKWTLNGTKDSVEVNFKGTPTDPEYATRWAVYVKVTTKEIISEVKL